MKVLLYVTVDVEATSELVDLRSLAVTEHVRAQVRIALAGHLCVGGKHPLTSKVVGVESAHVAAGCQ